MSKPTVLVIEDEKNIVELITYNLEQDGFRVVSALKGDQGLDRARKDNPDLILLDLMLPELSGIDICKILKQNPKTAGIPVIMLTAKNQESDKIVGLELGADDYITKPFSPRELLARVKAVLRRGRTVEGEISYEIGVLKMDPARHLVSVKSKAVALTSKEYDLLKTLIEANGRVLSRDYLLNQVWGYDPSLNIETRTVDMHLGQLRKKIGPEAKRIVTVKNVGYRFDRD